MNAKLQAELLKARQEVAEKCTVKEVKIYEKKCQKCDIESIKAKQKEAVRAREKWVKQKYKASVMVMGVMLAISIIFQMIGTRYIADIGKFGTGAWHCICVIAGTIPKAYNFAYTATVSYGATVGLLCGGILGAFLAAIYLFLIYAVIMLTKSWWQYYGAYNKLDAYTAVFIGAMAVLTINLQPPFNNFIFNLILGLIFFVIRVMHRA